MIETEVISESPIIILHRVSGRVTETEALAGVREAMSIIDRIAGRRLRCRLLLDMRAYVSDDMASHRIWSVGFKEQPSLKQSVEFVAIVGEDRPQFRAERELMESPELRFFSDPKSATRWLSEA